MKKILSVLILSSLILPAGALAQGTIEIDNPLTANNFQDIVDNLLDFIFKIAVVLVPLIVVFGGFLVLTSAGNMEQFEKGKKTIIWAAVGFGIILLSKGILTIINQILGVKGG